MVFMATMITVVLSVGFGQDSGWLVVLIGAILLGVIMVVMPAFIHPWTKKITGNDAIAIGHFGSLGYLAAGIAGAAVGRRSKSTEEIEFPQSLKFLRDSMVATSLSMVLIYMVFTVWGLIALPGNCPSHLWVRRRRRVRHVGLRPGPAVRSRRRGHPLRSPYGPRRTRSGLPRHCGQGGSRRQGRPGHPHCLPVRRQRRPDRIPLILRWGPPRARHPGSTG